MPRDPQDIRAMADVMTPFAVRTVATLGVPDIVRDGPLPVAEIARQCAARPDPLGRVLRFLVHHGMFTEPERDVFGPDETSHALCGDHPGNQRAWLDLDSATGRADLAFVQLIEQVRGGECAYSRIFGRTFWQDLAENEQLADSFVTLMEGTTYGLASLVAHAHDWSRYTSIADVGGGKGVLLADILNTHTQVYGKLVDLAEPISHAEQYLRHHDLATRTEISTANFFEPLPISAQALVLCDVLGDWDDADAAQILRTCADATEPGGRVLIVEMLPEHEASDATGSNEAATMDVFTELDLRMMVYAGGRMRDLTAFREVADVAGLDIHDSTDLENGYVLLECVPRAEP